MVKTLKLSSFLFFLKLEKDKYVVYNSLFLKKFFCDKETTQKIKSLQIEDTVLLDYLQKNYFFIDSKLTKEEEINLAINIKNIDISKPKFKVFYFILTTACNFRCKYCYLSSLVDYNPRIMSIDTAKKTLDYFYNYIKEVNDEVPKIVLYGGEPLLNKEVMRFIIKEVRKKIKENKIPFTNIILITNSSLLDKATAEFLKNNQVLVALSLDGPKEINDKNRVYKDGSGTYEDTIKSIRLLEEIGIKPTISCTINEENVNSLSKIIPWMIKNFKIDSLGLNLFTGGDCSNKTIKRLSEDSSKKIIQVFKVCRKYGIYEDTVLRQMKAFVKEEPNIYYCAATGREIAVDPEGNLATCPAFLNSQMFPFNISNNPILEENNKFKEWARRTPLLNEKCYDCIALGLCGGGCAYNSYKNHKDIFAVDEFYCNYAKNITQWMIKDLYKIMKKNGKLV